MPLCHQISVSRLARQYSRTDPVSRLGSYIVILVIVIGASLGIHGQETSNPAHKPFRVLWNIPDGKCRGLYDTDLHEFEIVDNKRTMWVGEEIATLYNPGLWPYLENNDKSRPVNGGLPQNANLTAHLKALRETIASQLSKDATGYGVIDMELWFMLFALNVGAQKAYRGASQDRIYKDYRIYKGRLAEAERQWDKSASKIMLASLKAAQETRPNMYWGYYLYPRTWWEPSYTIAMNDKMAALYRLCTALYPSIYIKESHEAWTHDYYYKRNREVLAEALRVRAVHSRRNIPIMAYVFIQNGLHNFFNESLLELQIGQPADMGMDGVVIWGSYRLFKPDQNAGMACKLIQNYVRNTLGPYISNLMEKLTSCSKTLCNGQGRCVKNVYAKSVPYILGVDIKNGPPDIENSPHKVYSDYQCQCYDDWTGTSCDTPTSFGGEAVDYTHYKNERVSREGEVKDEID